MMTKNLKTNANASFDINLRNWRDSSYHKNTAMHMIDNNSNKRLATGYNNMFDEYSCRAFDSGFTNFNYGRGISCKLFYYYHMHNMSIEYWISNNVPNCCTGTNGDNFDINFDIDDEAIFGKKAHDSSMFSLSLHSTIIDKKCISNEKIFTL